MRDIFIGTAGWTLSKLFQPQFLDGESHLEKYANIFNAVEINSSFYREHKQSTYARWAAIVPEHFAFSVKLSRYFTQESRLLDHGSKIRESIKTIGAGLELKWKCLLVQMPPSLEFKESVAEGFFSELRRIFSQSIIVEPRHPSWGQDKAIALFQTLKINKALADPEKCPTTKDLRKRVENLRYYRLHGTPQIYKSSYPKKSLLRLKKAITEDKTERIATWIIFDNTTFSHATENARDLQKFLK